MRVLALAALLCCSHTAYMLAILGLPMLAFLNWSLPE